MHIPRLLQHCLSCFGARPDTYAGPEAPTPRPQGHRALYSLDEIPEDLVPLAPYNKPPKRVRFALPLLRFGPSFPPHPAVRIKHYTGPNKPKARGPIPGPPPIPERARQRPATPTVDKGEWEVFARIITGQTTIPALCRSGVRPESPTLGCESLPQGAVAIAL